MKTTEEIVEGLAEGCATNQLRRSLDYLEASPTKKLMLVASEAKIIREELCLVELIELARSVKEVEEHAPIKVRSALAALQAKLPEL